MFASTSGALSNNNGSYSNDKFAGDVEYGLDPASGGFLALEFKKYDDLKEMLDSNKDSLKLEAMKRIIGMVAKGKDASELFPAVVKNVVSKNIEVKKLVYVYLVRYAEEQQDLALLSISTFQRALKEPNQLIRAGALRVLSSIRVTMIVPIVLLAIKDAAADMSPYVRKTAAHAIPKLYSLDREQKPELIAVIERLLADRTTLVMGSAVMAFTEVCPERSDLIHKVYRKLCNLLVDVDEWGQVVILNMLTRYARTQFRDPNIPVEPEDKSGRDSSSEGSEPSHALDADHRLLLRAARPLLQSRNASVVMAVAQLYHHAAPHSEETFAARALIRLLRSHTEVQCIVLDAIASIAVERKGIFEPFLKSFFVRTSDPTRVKLLKLEILTSLATETNVSVILRELRTYISNNDKQFVAATIQAIGHCACGISQVTDSCLNGLVSLLSNKDEAVVAESVVVIKRLLQTKAVDPKDIVAHMARLLDTITVAQARAAILWLLGEHSKQLKHIAPDVLRKIAKTFCQEHDLVKLQALNLAVKLYITNPEQTEILCQYVFSLSKYDQNYDIRDRGRLLKHFTKSPNGNFILTHAEDIFLSPKPAPMLATVYKDRKQFQLGSLSHFIKMKANGYEPLEPFPTETLPSNVRDVKTAATEYSPEANEKFSWASGSSGEPSYSEGDDDDEDDEEDDDDEDDEDADDGESESESDKRKSGSSESSSDSSDAETSASSSEEEDESASTKSAEPKEEKKPAKEPAKEPTNLDLLLDLGDDDTGGAMPVMLPAAPVSLEAAPMSAQKVQQVSPSFVQTEHAELLNRINGSGLGVSYRFTRTQHLFSPLNVNINLLFQNFTQNDISDIRVGKKTLSPGMTVTDFSTIPCLKSSCSLPASLGVDFNDSIQPAVIEILSSLGSSTVSLKPRMGELVRPVTMAEAHFEAERSKLRGMNEHSAKIPLADRSKVASSIFQAANVGACPSSDPSVSKFAAQTLSSCCLVLLTISVEGDEALLVINSEKLVVGSILLNEIKSAIKQLGS